MVATRLAHTYVLVLKHIGTGYMNPQGYWDRIASKYDGLYADAYSEFEDSQVLKYLQGVGVAFDASVIELGCGSGLGAGMVKALGVTSYVGVDLSETMLDMAEHLHPDVKFLQCDMVELPNSVLPADVVFCINGVGSYASDLHQFAHTIGEKTKVGGKVFISFLNKWSLRRLIRLRLNNTEPLQTRGAPPATDGSFQRVYGRRELKAAFTEAGFKNIKVFSYGLFGGVLQTRSMAKIEHALPELGHYFGHTVVLIGEK